MLGGTCSCPLLSRSAGGGPMIGQQTGSLALLALVTAIALHGCGGGGDDPQATTTTTTKPTPAPSPSPSPHLGCLSNKFIESMHDRFRCDTIAQLGATKADLGNGNCHVQGIATLGSGRIVQTCQGNADGYGHILSFNGTISNTMAQSGVKLIGSDKHSNHPSAIQLFSDGTLPVAFALGKDRGPATIRFFTSGDNGLRGPLGQTIQHAESHMGALAVVEIRGTYHIIGCGWSCQQLGVWSSNVSATEGYTRTFYTPKTSTIVNRSDVNGKVGEYNSLFLTTRCEDEQPLLFATHSTWIDVWEVHGLGSSEVTMKKLSKRKITESVVKHGLRSIFMEGVTLVPSEDGNGATIYASPHDFDTGGCKNGQECQAYTYICRFGDKFPTAIGADRGGGGERDISAVHSSAGMKEEKVMV